jgi:hypothetical protein
MADLADHAYAHAVAVLGVGEPALDAAVVGVRRGGRSRMAVLGHTRAAALDRRLGGAPPATDLDGAVPDDLTELAVALAGTRPPFERAVLDLDGRHGLDRATVARALGTSAAAASAHVTAVASAWDAALDPVVLARLGPGGCDELAAVLGHQAVAAGASGAPAGGVLVADGLDAAGEGLDGESPTATATAVAAPATLRELIALGPAVADHVAGCAVCGDRLRSMVSVRTLLGQRPLEVAPTAVRAASASSRTRRPSLPPPLEPVGVARRWGRPVATVAAALVVARAGGAAAAALRHDDGGAQAVRALTRVPIDGSVLVASPTAVAGPRPRPVRLTNRAERALAWTAVPDAAWLTVSPSEGRLDPGASAVLTLRLVDDAPEGALRGAVQISGDDGSAAMVRIEADVEHPPDVAATLDGCTVAAVVEDEGEVASVELHWYEPVDAGAVGAGTGSGRTTSAQGRVEERIAAMTATTDGYSARLPSLPSSVPWWVVAADARGNRARTADQVLSPGSCP